MRGYYGDRPSGRQGQCSGSGRTGRHVPPGNGFARHAASPPAPRRPGLTPTPAGTLLTVTERGFGKRTEIDEYRVQSRGGVGVINISTSERNGAVAGIAYVEEGDELLLITQQGMIIRMPTNDVRSIGRATQGVRLIDIEGEDKVVSVARLVERDDAGDGGNAD